MFHEGPSHNKWKLSLTLIQMLWDWFVKARVNAQHALLFSVNARDNTPLGVEVFFHWLWPRAVLYAFPLGCPDCFLLPLSVHSEGESSGHFGVTRRHEHGLVPDHDVATGRETMAAPMVQRCTVTTAPNNPPPPSDAPAAVGVATEWEYLEKLGLPLLSSALSQGMLHG